nr:hypothetical protein [Mycolicibacterium sp. CBMA 295]
MHEVVCIRLDLVARDIAATHLDSQRRQAVEEPGIQVGGDDTAGGPDAPTEPSRHRTPARAHLQAMPARPHPDGFHGTDCGLVTHRFKPPQTLPFLRRFVIGGEVPPALIGIDPHGDMMPPQD